MLQDAESRLIGDIYDAALDPRLWPGILRQVTLLTETNSAAISAVDALNPDYALTFTYNIPEAVAKAYRDDNLNLLDMELNGRPMMQRGVGSTLLSTEVYGSQEEYIRRGGELYERVMAPSNIYYLAATLLDQGDYRFAALGIHRPADWPALEQEQARQLGRLAPHFRRSLQIHRQLTSVHRQNARLYGILHGLVAGVLLVSSTGRLRYANPPAEHLLRHHGSLQVRDNQLQATDPAQNVQLQALLASAITVAQREGGAAGAGGVIGLDCNGRQRCLMLTVAPLSELAGYAELASDDIAAAIFLTDPKGRHLLSRKILGSAYALTRRECEICESFVNTGSLEATAAECGLSLASVRTYIKDIYAKTGQRSQAELMRLLMGLRINFEHVR